RGQASADSARRGRRYGQASADSARRGRRDGQAATSAVSVGHPTPGHPAIMPVRSDARLVILKTASATQVACSESAGECLASGRGQLVAQSGKDFRRGGRSAGTRWLL